MNRRSLISALAVTPVLVSGWAASARSAARFTPSPAPMRLERTLIRHLRGDDTLAVTRRWTVRFSRAGRGFLVSGQQVDASVAAPPSLTAFARIEEARVDEGMFPLTLDRLGHIMGGGNAGTVEAVEEAARIAQAKFAQVARRGAGLQSPDPFLASLQQTGSEMLSEWPRALFNPAYSVGVVEREIAAAGKASGLIRLEVEAQAEPGTGLLQWMTRRIETRIGSSSRISEERWRLAAE